ncbi:MAG TPA: ligase-associated DNA damage response endonuclease PdeM [Chitinophagaceae bacterium]|nr:ligase-associated DNA damage response endonuclease PdeM [Chitinophagaceae bacterium]HQV86405.1 ligase-associated DNA damage response endonuclease PdeM [Chitinophagaceae bacterium]HQX73357.1 ligase-associated DNA damage response endonuclease PdeM [Chitinophagaceae bacterium]
MQNPVPHIIRNNTFWVSPERCLLWEEENTLIVADLHLGKSGHFRKSGIGIPQSIYKADLQRLMAQLYLYKVDRLIIAGDLTHSTANKELDLFLKWRKDFSLLHIDLVKGNHDILADSWYEEAAIKVSTWKMKTGPFIFLHDLKAEKDLTAEEKGLYRFTGHLHPAINLKGKGKQSLKFPCFYFTKEYCILPAFSRFTAGFKVNPEKDETVFAIVEDGIMQLP